jgi:hypothetical protein
MVELFFPFFFLSLFVLLYSSFLSGFGFVCFCTILQGEIKPRHCSWQSSVDD